MKSFVAGKNEAGQRFDKYLGKLLREAPKSFLYKMLRKKNITLNGKKATGSEKLKEGDEIKLFLSDETFQKFCGQSDNSSLHEETEMNDSAYRKKKAREFARRIIYEDEDLLFWNKPQGILSQPDSSDAASVVWMLQNYLLESGRYKVEDLTTFRPGPVNRLDRNTGGIVLCGISLKGLQFLSGTVHDRTLKKIYVCMISGELAEGCYKAWLRKDEKSNLVSISPDELSGSRQIITSFKLRAECGKYKLAEADLITGRPHQIRAHLAYLGCSILGDPKYGDPVLNKKIQDQYGIRYQMLHAESITFPELSEDFSYLSGRTFKADLPESFHILMQDPPAP